MKADVRALAMVAFTGAVVPTASPAQAQEARLAFEADQGVILDSPTRLYAFDARFVPGLDIGRLRLSADIAASFTNPKWDVAIGLAPSIILFSKVTSSTGLRLTADGVYFLRNNWRVTGGLVLDFDGFYFGVVGGYDSLHDAAVGLTTLGVRIPTFIKVLSEI